MDWRLEESDSENDIIPTNVYTYQNGSMNIYAKGPNVNTTNVTGISFRNNALSSAMPTSRNFERSNFLEPGLRNNALSSTMQMSRNFERSRFLEPTLDQRSMYSRREISPMSMYSGSGVRNRNLHQSHYGAMSSQRSLFNGRSGSPISMQSMGSNATLSATDIADAFKNVKFNKFDLRIIKDAYNKLMKKRVRQKIEKRRNMRLYLKGYRRKSGYDSGEQGSDSSISSDNCRSTSSALYKNMSSCRSTRTNISEFRQCIRDTNMYTDCSENLKSRSFKSKFPQSPNKVNNKIDICLESVSPTGPQRSQGTKFHNGLSLQMFNKTVVPIPMNDRDRLCTKKSSLKSKESNEILTRNNNCNTDFDSDEEEIFSQVTIRERSLNDIETNNNKKSEGKRNLDNDNHQSPTKKKAKISKSDDFQFLKPQFPLRKSGTSRVKEKLISKSAAPLTDIAIPQMETVKRSAEKHSKDKTTEKINDLVDDKVGDQSDVLSHIETTNEVAMRPSFIKRKLYTQKMDVIENKNPDGLNSSQNDVYSAIQREKHKARKLVTNQSCLNRDVNQEDNNLLDLIHKIVPPDQMNMTNVTNKTSLSSKNSQEKKSHDDERWDVTSVISTCNNDNVSDTYTDEEIFNNDKNVKSKRAKVKNDHLPSVNQCKIVVGRLPVNKPLCPKNVIDDQKKSLHNRVKSFWDTDFESDMDSNLELKENRNQGINQCVMVAHDSPKRNNILSYSMSSADKEKSIRKCNIENRRAGVKKYNINRNLTISISHTPARTDSLINQTYSDLNESIAKPKNIDVANSKKTPIKNKAEPKITKVNIVSKDIKADNRRKKTANKIDRVLPAEFQSVIVHHVESKQKCDSLKSSKENTQAKSIKGKRTPTLKVKNDDIIPKDQDILCSQFKTADINKNLKTSKSNKGITNIQNKVTSSQNKINIDFEKILRPNKTPKKIDCCKDDASFAQGSKVSSQERKEILNHDTFKLSKPTAKVCKIVKQTNCNNKSSTQNSKTNKGKVMDTSPPKMDESMTRTLRSRKIDLSSSLNSSLENVTNMTIRSLRTRRINLSSSINNSTLEGNTSNSKSRKALNDKSVSQLNKNGRRPNQTTKLR